MIVYLLDVDNTLLDNDRVKVGLTDTTVALLGADRSRRFWAIYEDVRREIGHVDVPETLNRLLAEDPQAKTAAVADAFAHFPYDTLLFPAALDVIAALRAMGSPVILSDGDDVFQRNKIDRSGLTAACEGRVLVYPHKEDRINDVLTAYPADRYWMVDDKARLLGKFKAALGDRVSTIQVKQGHYSSETPDTGDPAPDAIVADIGDVIRRIGGEGERLAVAM